jgi:hypothetical protein
MYTNNTLYQRKPLQIQEETAMTMMSSTDFEKAFLEKYPQGSFTRPTLMQNSITIQFVSGGKKYTYRGRYIDVSRKLGLID